LLSQAPTALALADLRQAVELAPDYAPARVAIVEALLRDNPQQTLVHLDWLNQHQPNDLEVRLLTARAHRNLGQPEEAGKILDEILMVQPDKVAALVERGRVAMDLNRPDDAKGWLDRAFESAPNQREVLLALSDCSRQMNRLEDAKRYRDRANEIDAQLLKILGQMTGKGQR
jgi:tetratricopeptide (TPR) repeat protein